MRSFTCNICGTFNCVTGFASEPASCACGSNVRTRALIHLLSVELFGRSLSLPDFPQVKALRGIGMSDKDQYARILAGKFDYTNTYHEEAPRLDITEPHPEWEGACDFVLSADVLEHVPPPIDRALGGIVRLLGPTGFLVATVPCPAEGPLREHFPELHQFRILRLGDKPALVNRRRDGGLEITDDLVFHGGTGLTLEMRSFGIADLERALLAAGFREVYFLSSDVPEIGVFFDNDVLQPLVARKQTLVMDRSGVGQIVDALRDAQARAKHGDVLAERIRLASRIALARVEEEMGPQAGFHAGLDMRL